MDNPLQKERDVRDERVKKLAEGISAQILQNVDSLDRGKVLANALIGIQADKRGASILHGVDLEWMVDALVSYSIPQCLNELNAIFDKMIEHGFVDGKKFDWNDMDNWITVNRTEYPKVMTFGSQNFSWIVIFTDRYGDGTRNDVKVYRLYEAIDKEHMLCEPVAGETKIEYAQRATETFDQYYTDNIKRDPHVSRPDYAWFEERGFDAEKIGKHCFIKALIDFEHFMYETFGETKVQHTMYSIADYRCLFFETETALLAIEEEPDFQK